MSKLDREIVTAHIEIVGFAELLLGRTGFDDRNDRAIVDVLIKSKGHVKSKIW